MKTGKNVILNIHTNLRYFAPYHDNDCEINISHKVKKIVVVTMQTIKGNVKDSITK